ncbi:MAG: hypothetical protein LAP21_08315 [Acidobacteriia bacterium]|nr:hypothetical protein [Terriglobia bacterium]
MERTQIKVDPRMAMKMSDAARTKGEEFIQALIDDNHGYESMKHCFLAVMAKKAMSLKKGVIVDAADLLRMHRNRLSQIVNAMDLKEKKTA